MQFYSASNREDNTQTRTTVFHGQGYCGEMCKVSWEPRDKKTSGEASWKWAMSAELYLEEEMVGLVSETGRDGTQRQWMQGEGACLVHLHPPPQAPSGGLDGAFPATRPPR